MKVEEIGKMGNINFNFNFSASSNTQTGLWSGLNTNALSGVNDILSDLFTDFSSLLQQFSGGQSNFSNIAAGGCCQPPNPADSYQPQGSLKTEGGVITTPGGYKIEATGQHEWKITGPDGKETKVWGDPHVAEGDGGKWDFKKNSTFVLGDGTKVNVTTAPWGNDGMTVTKGLEVISGNDRVTVEGIDKGKGVVGQVTQDGFAHANSFNGDVFVMGNETDDWSHQGKEIIGSENGGDSFKLGNDLPAGNRPTSNYNNWSNMFSQWLNSFTSGNNWNNSWKPNQFGSNPYYNGLTNGNRFSNARYDQNQHRNQLSQAFRLMGSMFNLMARMSNLSDRMNAFRNRTMYA